jgi:hypothetical protein
VLICSKALLARFYVLTLIIDFSYENSKVGHQGMSYWLIARYDGLLKADLIAGLMGQMPAHCVNPCVSISKKVDYVNVRINVSTKKI